MGKDHWLKLHTSLLTSSKFLSLSPAHKWAFICVLLLTKKGLKDAPEKFVLAQLSMSKKRWKGVRKDLIDVGLLDADGCVNGFEDSQLTPDAYRKRKQRARDKERDVSRDKSRDIPLDSRVQSAECREDKNPPTPQRGAKGEALDVMKYWNTTYRRNISAPDKIRDRIKAGASVDDCKLVVDYWTQKWTGTKFQEFLRPATLFAPTKFNDYLSEAKEGKVKTDDFNVY